MKHTPGKWDCGESIDGMWYVETDHAPGEMIAEIMMRAPGEAEANASLMAAAPKILAALVEAVELIETISPMEGDTLRRARAAIEKAVGHNTLISRSANAESA